MGSRPSLFRSSPFARQMVVLFIGCALLPLAGISVLSYRSVERNLLEQARLGLQQQSKLVGMGVVERLLSLEAALRFTALQIQSFDAAPTKSELEHAADGNLVGRFDAVFVERADGSRVTLLGEFESAPELAIDEREHLTSGRTLLRTGRSGGASVEIVLVREVTPSRPGEARLWARVDPEYLWGLGARNTLPPRTELAVVDEAGGLVIRSEAIPSDFPQRFTEAARHSSGRWVEWRDGSREYLGGSWKIPMQTNYLAGAWTVVLSEDLRSLMRPVAAFRSTFPPMILLTLWLVLLLSLSQIRRLLGPLEQLRMGTQRLARGDFGQPVRVTSRDEFAELAKAFNSMAEQLREQFETLATMETVARTALGAGDRSRLIQNTLPLIRRLLGCERLGLWVLEPGGREVLVFTAADGGDGRESLEEGREAISTLPALDDLRSGRPRRVGDTGAVLPGRASSSAPSGGVLFPLMAGGTLIAVLVLEGENALDAALRVEGELARQLAVVLQQSQLRSALEGERRRLEMLLEYLPSGVLLLDDEQRVVLANQIARDCLEVLAPAAVGDRLEALGGLAISDLVSYREPVPHEVVTGGRQPRVFHVVGGRVRAADAPRSTVIVLRETTREREREAQMQRQERLAAVGQLAAGISHDFNNLLQGITMAAELLRLTPEAPESARRSSRIIGQEAQRGARLIRQILDFSRQAATSRTAVDVGQVLDETLELLRRTLPESITVHFDRPGAEIVVMADAVQLQQVFMNLAVNARDAMPDGGRLELHLSTLSIEEFATRPVPEMRPGEWVRIQVVDTGHGIPPEIGGRIFEPFFTTKAEGLGTGLGLAQVYGLVRQHGGHVEYTSSSRGTVFSVYLPHQPSLSSEVAATTIHDDPLGRGERVLVVENRRSLLDSTCRTLERLGFRATGVATAHDAILQFDQATEDFDVVLTDIIMPGMGGLELVDALRRGRPALPVVLMSGFVADHHMARLEGVGGGQVLHKPFGAPALARALRRALSQ